MATRGKQQKSPAAKGDGALTVKQQLFVEAYLGVSNGNGTDAARRAGYKGNAFTLKQVAAENLAKPYIAERVQQRLDEAKGCMGADEVLAELTDVGRADWREFIEVRLDKDGETIEAKLRLNDKLKALELLGKHHKLFTDNLEIGAKKSLVDVIREAVA